MQGRPFQVLQRQGIWAVFRKGQAVPVAEYASKREAVAQAAALAAYFDESLVVVDGAPADVDVVARESLLR